MKYFSSFWPFTERSSFTSAFSNFASLAKLFVVSLSLLFATMVHSDQSASPDSVTNNYKLIVLGDSLSAAYGLTAEQGWVYLLAEKWQSKALPITVVNAAISGDTTDGGLARLPRLLALHQPTHLYIELGGNNALQGHNPLKIKQNLVNMVDLAQSNDVNVIIQEMQIPTNYGARYTRAFTSLFHEIAEEKNIPIVPFFLQDIALKPGLMQRDGIHPTKEAQPMIVEFMSDKLISAIDAKLLAK